VHSQIFGGLIPDNRLGAFVNQDLLILISNDFTSSMALLPLSPNRDLQTTKVEI
jgi:hypothetical protein